VYIKNQNFMLVLLIGIAVGLAVLCKWLIGLFVFFLWFIHFIVNNEMDKAKSIKHLIVSFFVSLFVFAPWQLYGLFKYRTEYLNAMKSNSDHIFKCLEGHCGDILYYYDALHEQFGQGVLIPIIFILSILSLLFFCKEVSVRLLFLGLFFSFYTFFTITKTKMLGYVLILLPFYWTSITYNLQLLRQLVGNIHMFKLKAKYIDLLIVFMPLLAFNYNTLNKHHGLVERGRIYNNSRKEVEKIFFKDLKLGDKNTLIFSDRLSYNGHIAAMFYSDYQVYNYIPTEELKRELERLNRKYLILK